MVSYIIFIKQANKKEKRNHEKMVKPEIVCDHCGSRFVVKTGLQETELQWFCKTCDRFFGSKVKKENSKIYIATTQDQHEKVNLLLNNLMEMFNGGEYLSCEKCPMNTLSKELKLKKDDRCICDLLGKFIEGI